MSSDPSTPTPGAAVRPLRFYLTGQNNFGNRGCEALVRSTVGLVREALGPAEFLVPSLDIPRDSAQWPDASAQGVRFVAPPPLPRRFVHWERLTRRLPLLARLPWPTLSPGAELTGQLRSCDAVLSIGGDNYSLDYDLASLFYFVGIAEAAKRLGKPVVLWGASVGPFSRLPGVEAQLAAHLRHLDLIAVRESHSRDYLASLGVRDNVLQVADSAFTMVPEPLEPIPGWPRGALTRNQLASHDPGIGRAGGRGVLGLNVSPLIERVRAKAGVSGDLRREVAEFIRASVAEGWSVLLVPHVAPLSGQGGNNDQVFLGEILALTGSLDGRVGLVTGQPNAPQLKYIIACCRLFIGARTHATIAALSSGVPTVSIAYSVKARGINRDLFGHEDYVLDTARVSAATLLAARRRLEADEDGLHAQLAERLPEWRSRARAGAAALGRLLAARPTGLGAGQGGGLAATAAAAPLMPEPRP